MRILDRYVLRNFLEPFLICLGGFIALLLIVDLFDNGPDFIEYHVKIKTVLSFYLTQLPAMALIAMPVGLLLALLFSLSKMSRHNEIISMLTAGRSLLRVIVPLMLMGLVITGVCFWLNMAQAPHADAVKKQMLEEITRGSRRAQARNTLEAHLFRDRLNGRTWYVQKLRPGSTGADKKPIAPALEGIHITQQDADGDIVKKWYAARALYDPRTGNWTLIRGMIVEFSKVGDIIRTDNFASANPANPNDYSRVITGWPETPWRIASSAMLPQNLSIAELREYLKFNSDFPDVWLAPYRTNLADRWAMPWGCFVIVFFASPLGIVYNRRGVLGAVIGAIFLFVATILVRGFLLALGKGARLDPLLAAWIPNAVFLLIGLVLLWFRSTNRDFPRLKLWPF
jgi:LPS export ABC transporter permease LptG